MQFADCSFSVLRVIVRLAITMTAVKRKSLDLLQQYEQAIQSISIDPQLGRLWRVYQKEYVYAADISFTDLIGTLHIFSDTIGILSLPE